MDKIKWPPWCQNDLIGKEQSFQQIMLGKLDIYMQQNEGRPLPNIIYKNLLNMGQRP